MTDYQTSLREASNAAWEENWQEAIEAFNKALEAKPDDAQALTGLALSVSELGRPQEALDIYKRVASLVPDDPLPHERMAVLFEELDRDREAANEYLQVGEVYYARKELERAISYWRKAAKLNVDLHQPHMRLAAVYEQHAETRPKAINEYVEMARLLQVYGESRKAERALQRALKLDTLNAVVRTALDDLKHNRPISTTEEYTDINIKQTGPLRDPSLFTKPEKRKFVEEDDSDLDVLDAAPERTPFDEAARHAMSLLADSIWDGGVPSSAQPALLQAIDLQQVGEADAAIAAYTQAQQAGLNNIPLRVNLGILHYYTEDYEQAVQLLTEAVADPKYRLASLLALGLSRLKLGDVNNGAQIMIQALQEADKQTNPGQVDIHGYERLQESLEAMTEKDVIYLAESIGDYLLEPAWYKRMTQTLGGFSVNNRTAYVPSLIELMVEHGQPAIAEITQRIDYYIEQNALTLATSEAQYAIEQSPEYLPVHRRIADVLIKQNRTKDAAEKLNLIGEAYLIRGNEQKATVLFQEVLEIWPADISARQRLLHMLLAQERVEEALVQYSELGDLHYRLMADTNKAFEYYMRGLEYARENEARGPYIVAILKSVAEIEQQRLNWQQALEYYEQIAEIAPDDEASTMALIDLYFQTNRAKEAVNKVDDFIRQCITRGKPGRIIPTLEFQVKRHPTEVGLRMRLAQVYARAKRKDDAVKQLDKIGEMQIDAGDFKAAVDTISKIIQLNPEDVDRYRQLLAQIKSSAGIA